MQLARAGVPVHRNAVGCTGTAARRSLVVNACAPKPGQHNCFDHIFTSCAARAQQLWTAATAHHQHRQLQSRSHWQQSLGIGAGVSAVACNGAGGFNGPPGSGGWGSGGGGHSWGHTPGNSSPGSTVLADVAAAGEVSDTAVEEVVLLDVGGMKCGGCVGHVKQLLEQHPLVSSASVNLATETALVRVKLAAGADLSTTAAELAKVLTAAGFPAAISKKQKAGVQ